MRDKEQRLMSVEAPIELRYEKEAKDRFGKIYGEPTRIHAEDMYWDNVESGKVIVGIDPGPTKATIRYLFRELIDKALPTYKAPLDYSDE